MKYINESSGVMDDPNLVSLAEFLYKRVYKLYIQPKPRYKSSRSFTIPLNQWEKFNSQSYPLFGDKFVIKIDYSIKNANASYESYGYPVISYSYDFLSRCYNDRDEGYNYFISTTMHELTHAVNELANVSDIWSDSRELVRNYNTNTDEFSVDNIDYLFRWTEMNARITGAYYHLWLGFNKESDEAIEAYVGAYINKQISASELVNFLFQYSCKWTCCMKMYQLVEKEKSKESSNASLIRRLERDLYLFKRRIYKMLSKFVYDIKGTYKYKTICYEYNQLPESKNNNRSIKVDGDKLFNMIKESICEVINDILV